MVDQPDGAKSSDEAALVPLLVVMTVVTGVVDAVSFLRLGHVFVANMTGNVVFLGFALAGAPRFSASASLVALAAFVVGAAVGGRLAAPTGRAMLARMATSEATLCAAATGVAVVGSGTTARYAMTVLLAVAMGGQNAVVRRLAVPAMTTTTVLTTTLTALVAEPPDLSTPGSHTTRRAAVVAAMLAGAALGALLLLHIDRVGARGGRRTPCGRGRYRLAREGLTGLDTKIPQRERRGGIAIRMPPLLGPGG